VPAKLSARARVFDTGQGGKTDPVDAHSVAVAGLRSRGLRQVHIDDTTLALRLMVDRRAELGRTRTEVVNRIHQMLLELIPGGAKKFLTRGQASYLLRTAPAPVGIVAQTRHQLAGELIDELTAIDAKIRAADKQLRQLVAAIGSSLEELNGIGPSGAARLIGCIDRFHTAAHFASWNGTAPIEASSGDQKRHRLSRACGLRPAHTVDLQRPRSRVVRGRRAATEPGHRGVQRVRPGRHAGRGTRRDAGPGDRDGPAVQPQRDAGRGTRRRCAGQPAHPARDVSDPDGTADGHPGLAVALTRSAGYATSRNWRSCRPPPTDAKVTRRLCWVTPVGSTRPTGRSTSHQTWLESIISGCR
jgi:Transposase IS116/IS110/IS902 family/Transposase